MMILAPRYGVSDRGLAKICASHCIPVPPRGYWAKVAAGKRTRKPILQKRTDGLGETVVIGSSRVELPTSIAAIAKKALRQDMKDTETNIASKITEESWHLPEDEELCKPIAKTVKYLMSKEPDKKGTIKANKRYMCGILINQVPAKRAAYLLHLFASEVEARGLILLAMDKHMTIKKEDTEVNVSLFEKCAMRLRHLNSTPEKSNLRYSGNLDQIEEKYDDVNRYERRSQHQEVWSGQLRFFIDAWTKGLRKTWSDGKKQRVESCVSDVVTGIEMILEQKRLDQIKRKKQEAFWAQQEINRRKERERQQLEKRRLEVLTQILQAKKEAEELENWLRSLSFACEDVKDPEYMTMLAWASDRVLFLKGASGVEAALKFSKLKDLFASLEPSP